ncbi:Gfo/Idh/MocA family protein [Pontibacillus marinus]|uniref:Oxidoreductase n=1 Tax=Pontibacillus marinus BH030004 = DSM 16465 TaxID=1385511 RepID=A0A0A5GH49_9BACI|nr:Gfo/Idh/MocA family oxidoreductase [Pontibacillus marinus]KGX90440.1 oxidoreductase [Pontibacillus marinus BH030004 = DSM 16465]
MSLRVALIGAGIISSEHLKAISRIEELQAVAIADIDEAKVNTASREYDLIGYLDYRDMVQKEKPDIVVISLPHFLHKDAAIFCARNGCHILLEKPMALNTLECDEMIQVASDHDVQLMIGHIQHYFPENDVAKKRIHEGILGQLVQINETRHMNYFKQDRPAWFLECDKAGGGIMMNLGAHSIDKIQWLLNSRFSRVMANLSYHHRDVEVSSDIEGSGLVYLETENEIPVTISISGYEVVPKHVTELIFTKGMMKVEVGKGVYVSQGGSYAQVPTPSDKSPFEKQFMELIDAIQGKRILENSGTYGKSVVSVIQGIYESHESRNMIEITRGGVD